MSQSHDHAIRCAALSLCLKPEVLAAFYPFIERMNSAGGNPLTLDISLSYTTSDNSTVDDGKEAEVQHYRERVELLGKAIDDYKRILKAFDVAGDELADACHDKWAVNSWKLVQAQARNANINY
jgi:hypothetical protein